VKNAESYALSSGKIVANNMAVMAMVTIQNLK